MNDALNQSPMAVFLVVFAVLMAAILLALPTTHWISQRMANVLSFFSLEKFRRPPPLLSKGDALAMQGHVYPAFNVFRRFLDYHPQDIEVYFRLIDLAFGPMQNAELGDAIIAYGVKRLDKRGRRVIKERRNAIVLGELYPLKHLAWRDETAYSHAKVEVPKLQRGQFAPREEEGVEP
ncbi:MAG: hypothetical protein ACPGJR_01640 [Akkermansiaceae bacterium]